jgi:thiamine pyrophosphokinase
MTSRHALVLADGALADATQLDRAWPGWADGIDLVIAADGGARHAAAVGLRIDRWVGDGDSIAAGELARLAAEGVRIDRAPVDKDETDAELAVRAALDADPARITILGALGGARVDHELGNVWLLAHPGLAGRAVVLLDGGSRIRLAGPGAVDLAGRIGDVVSLLPFGGDALGITTHGLRYPLAGEPLHLGPSRGLSNVRDAADAGLTLAGGRLLIVESPATL